MNQILITQRVYVTPELKRKKNLYKGYFILSIFLLISLFSYYIYAEYDRNKSEQVSKAILEEAKSYEDSLKKSNTEDNTVIRKEDNVIIVLLDHSQDQQEVVENESEQINVDDIVKQDLFENTVSISPGGTEYKTIGIINIPSINVSYPILSETTTELLKISPTKFWGPAPNEVGNFCIVGHNYRNKKFFSKVPTLSNGDIVEITDSTGTTLKYAVYDKYVVNDDELECTSQLTNGRKDVTLITCTNDSQKRVIVKCTEIK